MYCWSVRNATGPSVVDSLKISKETHERMPALLVVVCYDIPDDRRRVRLHKLLKNYGEPVQYSVFECALGRGEFDFLKSDVAQVIKREDNVRYYRLCAACEAKLQPSHKRRDKPLFIITENPGEKEAEAVVTPGIGSYSLMAQVCNKKNLREAWKRVKSNRGCAGGDRITLRKFALRLSRNLSRLRIELLDGTYEPQQLLLVKIPKKTGGQRTLGIPTVRDRIAQQSVYRVIAPIWEPHLSEASFAYRPGRSVGKAIRIIEKWRNRGFAWVVDADINSCFDNIDHDMLLDMVSARIDDQHVMNLISKWLKVRASDGKNLIERMRGVPQGGVIPPLLANIYLDYLDRKLLDEHYKLVRYADDFVVLCNNQEMAQRAVQRVEVILRELKLELNDRKTRITSFKDGFEFLGVFFKGRLRLPGQQARSKSRIKWRF